MAFGDFTSNGKPFWATTLHKNCRIASETFNLQEARIRIASVFKSVSIWERISAILRGGVSVAGKTIFRQCTYISIVNIIQLTGSHELPFIKTAANALSG